MPIQPSKKTKAPRQKHDNKWCLIYASRMILALHFILRNEARFDQGETELLRQLRQFLLGWRETRVSFKEIDQHRARFRRISFNRVEPREIQIRLLKLRCHTYRLLKTL